MSPDPPVCCRTILHSWGKTMESSLTFLKLSLKCARALSNSFFAINMADLKAELICLTKGNAFDLCTEVSSQLESNTVYKLPIASSCMSLSCATQSVKLVNQTRYKKRQNYHRLLPFQAEPLWPTTVLHSKQSQPLETTTRMSWYWKKIIRCQLGDNRVFKNQLSSNGNTSQVFSWFHQLTCYIEVCLHTRNRPESHGKA